MTGWLSARLSLGSFKVHGIVGVGALPFIGKVLLGALAIIPGCVWIVGAGVMVGGLVGYLGKTAYESYKKSEFKKWLQTQLQSNNLSPDKHQRYTEMLAKLMNC